MINGSLDSAENVELMIRTDCREITVYDMDCAAGVLSAIETDGAYRKFILPEVEPWQMRLVCEK
jgi:hypothetical protein